jgi:Ala-tRNA(Pro) deacylase
MSISIRLKQYLDKEGVAFEHHVHPTAYTSQEIAAAAHIPGREMAKIVIFKADDKLAMVVLSANDKVDLDALQSEIGCKILRLATEVEFRTAFPTCEVGAMPPFGNLFGAPIYCDATLENDERIEFNAGTHHDTIRMTFADYKRLANPKLADLKVHRLRRVG